MSLEPERCRVTPGFPAFGSSGYFTVTLLSFENHEEDDRRSIADCSVTVAIKCLGGSGNG